MAVCLPRLEELSLDLGAQLCYDEEEEAHPSVLALLAGSLPHLARLSVTYPGGRTRPWGPQSLLGGADVKVFQAGPGMTCCMPVPSKTLGSAMREAACALHTHLPAAPQHECWRAIASWVRRDRAPWYSLCSLLEAVTRSMHAVCPS